MSPRNVDGVYSCTECSMRFGCPSSLNGHFAAVHGGERPVCPTCGKKFTDVNNLNRHRRAKHSDLPFEWVCSACRQSFRNRHDNAKRHCTSKCQHAEPEKVWLEQQLEQEDPVQEMATAATAVAAVTPLVFAPAPSPAPMPSAQPMDTLSVAATIGYYPASQVQPQQPLPLQQQQQQQNYDFTEEDNLGDFEWLAQYDQQQQQQQQGLESGIDNSQYLDAEVPNDQGLWYGGHPSYSASIDPNGFGMIQMPPQPQLPIAVGQPTYSNEHNYIDPALLHQPGYVGVGSGFGGYDNGLQSQYQQLPPQSQSQSQQQQQQQQQQRQQYEQQYVNTVFPRVVEHEQQRYGCIIHRGPAATAAAAFSASGSSASGSFTPSFSSPDTVPSMLNDDNDFNMDNYLGFSMGWD